MTINNIAKTFAIAALVALCVGASGCTKQQKTVGGALMGATTGGLIGGFAGGGTGAAIGVVGGGLIGGIAGNSMGDDYK
jgi:uncharacterized protein YcfJ